MTSACPPSLTDKSAAPAAPAAPAVEAEAPKQDNWSADAYQKSASFVPQLATKAVALLSPAPHDRILDLGAGDGPLTAQIGAQCAYILGLDASPAMIAAAKLAHEIPGRCEFRVADCRFLAREMGVLLPLETETAETEGDAGAASAGATAGAGAAGDSDSDGKATQAPHSEEAYDKIFSNAALHWILRSPPTRAALFDTIHALLKPNGVFAFELGGAGNIAEVHAALVSALIHHGVPAARARAASPWFFPSETWMRAALIRAGFGDVQLETEYRPTRLPEAEAEGAGLEGWVRLMGAEFLALVEGERARDGVVAFVLEALKGVVGRPEDGGGEGGEWLGYVRLRGRATKAAAGASS
ncbi:MAG: hypothetical protein M1819_001935 [Sarea resinae]|nr:MAG: hypothetical protein M1819_001935 [Sarea resinae]